MGRRVCLAIGVSTVVPPVDNQASRFAYLDGAIFAARAIGEWAISAGLGDENVRIVDDGQVAGKDNPVTRDRVQQAVNALFPAGADVVEQMILSFCGHGLTDANLDSVSWLFSDSLSMGYRVVAARFYEQLLLYGIQRITLISDACRELPKSLDLSRLDPVRGINVQGSQVDSPKFDRFAACQDGQLGYMVSDAMSAAPGKCLFSGVIADVLYGKEAAAIKDGVITTATFGVCVRARTTERAKDYHLKLNPQCLVDPEPAVLYSAAVPLKAPAGLQPWPPAATAATMGPFAAAPEDPGDADRTLERVNTDPSFRKRVLGATFGLDLHDLAASNGILPIPHESKDLLQSIVKLRETGRSVQSRVQRLEADAVAETRKLAANDVHNSLTQSEPAGADGVNLIVWGNSAKLWSHGSVTQHDQAAGSIGFHVASDPNGTPVLVELADGSFTPVVPYNQLYAVVKPSTAGDVFQAYGERDSRAAFQSALEAIADFAAGRLGVDRLDELAGRLRLNKHVDPTLGVICAYLYRAMADFDSIRRMAYFYASNGQPVPFDIALLGLMQVTREAGGALLLHVPAVKTRPDRQGEAPLPDYVTNATPATQAGIGGRCPWLGLGWDYISLPRPDRAALVDGLADHARDVRRSGFTVLTKEAGLALARAWQLRSS